MITKNAFLKTVMGIEKTGKNNDKKHVLKNEEKYGKETTKNPVLENIGRKNAFLKTLKTDD